MGSMTSARGVFSQRLFNSPMGTWRRIWHMSGWNAGDLSTNAKGGGIANHLPLAVQPTSKRFIAPKRAWCQARGMEGQRQAMEDA